MPGDPMASTGALLKSPHLSPSPSGHQAHRRQARRSHAGGTQVSRGRGGEIFVFCVAAVAGKERKREDPPPQKPATLCLFSQPPPPSLSTLSQASPRRPHPPATTRPPPAPCTRPATMAGQPPRPACRRGSQTRGARWRRRGRRCRGGGSRRGMCRGRRRARVREKSGVRVGARVLGGRGGMASPHSCC